MKTIALSTVILVLTCASLTFGQGSLTPSGPPGPTMKTLADIEPRTPLNQSTTPGNATCVFRVTEPGSYYLPANLALPTGKSGIVIALTTPGTVSVDLMGFTIRGNNGDANERGVWVQDGASTNNALFVLVLSHGTIANCAGGGLVEDATVTQGVIESVATKYTMCKVGISTGAKLRARDVSVREAIESSIVMGNESSLDDVLIEDHAAGPGPIIFGSGNCHIIHRLVADAWYSGSVTTPAFSAGQDTRIDCTFRIYGGNFSTPLFVCTNGSMQIIAHEAEEAVIELNGVSGPCISNSIYSANLGGGLLGYCGNGVPHTLRATATDCTFTESVFTVGYSDSNYCPRIILNGTSSAPTALRVSGANNGVCGDITIANTASIAGAVVSVLGQGNAIGGSIRGLPGGSAGVLLLAGASSSSVESCRFIGRNDSATTAIRINTGVTNVFVSGNVGTRLAAGSTLVDNQGGATNAIAPLATAANITSVQWPYNLLH